jgi:hypothetical protein
MLNARTRPRVTTWLSARTNLVVLLTSFTFLALSSLSNLESAHSAGALGLRIDVLPNVSVDDSEPYAQNRRLWLVTSEAKATTRTVRITSSVNNAQSVTLEIAAAKRVGEATELNQESESEIAAWTDFSKKALILPAFGQEDIQITIDPPSNLTNYSQDAFLIVKSAATSTPTVDNSRTTAVLASQFQYATPLFYGVGNIKNLVSIQIKDVNTYIDENGKYAEIAIENNGVGPVEISGDIQFSNLDFQSTNIGPLTFTVPPLQPGKTKNGTLRLPDQMVAGKWKIFIQAYVGSYGEAVVITKDLSFEYKQSSQIPRLILLFGSLLLLIVLIISLRRLREDDSVDLDGSSARDLYAQPLTRSKFPRFAKVQSAQTTDVVDEDFDAWFESIRQSVLSESIAKKPETRTSSKKPKKVAQKSAVKKSGAKNVATKKKIAKKVVKKKPILTQKIPKQN